MESTYMELFITFLYPHVHDTSPRPRGCKNYPELPRELTEKLTGTADSTRLVSSNQARFTHYQYNTNITHSLYAEGGGPINASSGKPCGGNQ